MMNFILKLKNIKNSNTFAKAGLFYLFGNLFNNAIAFLTVPIFTHLLSTSDYGIVSTFASWVSIATVVVSLGLGSTVRNAYVDYKDYLDQYISSIITLSSICTIIMFIIAVVICNMFVGKKYIILVVLCIVQAYAVFVQQVITNKYMMTVEYVKRTILLAIPNILAVILSISLILLMNDYRYLARIYSDVIINTIISSILIFIIYKRGRVVRNIEYWKYGLSLSLPIIFHNSAVIILSSFDRTMLTALRSSSETGIYSLTYNLGMIVTVVTSSVQSIWIPWFTKQLGSGKRDKINKGAFIYMNFVSAIVCLILLVAPEILKVMASKTYWSGIYIIPPIVVASFVIFLYSLAVDTEYYYKKTKSIATNTVIAALINIVLNYIFIPKYGAVAAAWATVIAYVSSFILHYRVSYKIDSKLFPFKIYMLPIMTVIVCSICDYIFMEYFIIRWGIAIIIGVVVCSVVLHSGRLRCILKIKDE